ncbi:MAG: hypothetical protein NZM11_09685, partial [Anaerolineales bacterium]|nr:hypothetical protein [Anaerolineales bacterium]
MFQKLITGLLILSLTLSPVHSAQAAAPALQNTAAPTARRLATLPAAMQRVFREAFRNAPTVASMGRASASSVSGTAIPTPLAKPLVLARVQSAYTPSGLVSGTLTITYTVVNRLPLDELSGAEITVKLAPGVSLVSGPAYLTLSDGSLSFAVGEVGPADGASVAIVVSAPASPGNLDLGARASASFANKRVSAQTAPARLVSDAYAPFLGQQPEFMFNDVDLLEVAGLVEQDPVQAFALVRDATRWEAYRGSLRGARGTWWSEAGNALDRSSLLLGVLRTIGVPSRYVRGALTTAQQRALIGQMFEGDYSQIGISPPPDPSDPYNDVHLLSIANDHWWVEADLSSGWQALDVNFRESTIGALYGSGGQVVNAIPDADRHWTKIALTVEHLPALTGPAGKLETFKAFELVLPTAQIAGVPTAIGHFVRTVSDGGAVFYNIQHYYAPFVAVGGIRADATIYRGEEYLEQITNFPLANQRITAAWVEITVGGPGVPTETYQDDLVDRIGKLARRQGGTLNFGTLSNNTAPIVRDRQGAVLLVSPSWVPDRARNRAATQIRRQVAFLEEAKRTFDLATASTGGRIENNEQSELALRLMSEVMAMELGIASLTGMDTLRDADRQVRLYASVGRVAAYPATPRLIFTSFGSTARSGQSGQEVTWRSSSNLMRTELKFVAYPGQTRSAEVGLRSLAGAAAIASEYVAQRLLMAALDPTSAVSATQIASTTRGSKSFLDVMAATAEQGIAVEVITPENADKVERLEVSPNAKALLLETLQDRRRSVMVPVRTPIVGGEPYLAWLETDLETGLVEDRDEYNRHPALTWYSTSLYKNFEKEWFFALAGFGGGLILGMAVRLLVTLTSDAVVKAAGLCQKPNNPSGGTGSITLPPDAPEAAVEMAKAFESYATEDTDALLQEMCKYNVH